MAAIRTAACKSLRLKLIDAALTRTRRSPPEVFEASVAWLHQCHGDMPRTHSAHGSVRASTSAAEGQRRCAYLVGTGHMLHTARLHDKIGPKMNCILTENQSTIVELGNPQNGKSPMRWILPAAVLLACTCAQGDSRQCTHPDQHQSPRTGATSWARSRAHSLTPIRQRRTASTTMVQWRT
jgi:hypothetical protein